MAESTQVSPDVPVEEWLRKSLATTTVNPKPEVHVSILDDKAILLDLDTGAYHALNSVGTVIWEHFTPDHTLSQIHSILCKQYDVSEDIAREDLLELVTRLDKMGMVQLENR